MSRLFLGVDTSNYTTSLALVDESGVIRASLQKLLPVKDGEAGLRQSDAVFQHTKALPSLSEELFRSLTAGDTLAAVGVSVKPRDAEGSYMPCFLAGLSFASGVAGAMRLPLYRLSHQAGHIMAGVVSSEMKDTQETPFLSFHVSGGTTEALLVTPRDADFDCRKIGGTTDASAGQIIDRLGVLAGLPFPCGKALDELAKSSQKTLPIFSRTHDGSFSLSGLQNKCEKFLADGETAADTAKFLFSCLARTLERSTEQLRALYADLPVLYAGGVMSNSHIRSVLAKLKNTYFASPTLSRDNAVGVAYLARKSFLQEGATA